jgi:hypothetical protein
MPYTTQPSHLQRASSGTPLAHGDLTAQRAQLAREEQKETAAIIENSIRELQDPDIPTRIVRIDGRTTPAAVPEFVYQAIVRSARNGGAR